MKHDIKLTLSRKEMNVLIYSVTMASRHNQEKEFELVLDKLYEKYEEDNADGYDTIKSKSRGLK